MARIETRYSIGDVVWRANTSPTTKQHDCPDCLNTRVWKGTSPAGDEFSFPCPRCSTSYGPNDEMSLRYTAYEPSTQRLTIGSVRFNSEDEGGASYMAHETGVGSGNIWKEPDLFPTEAEALEAARIKCLVLDKQDWVAKRFNKTLSISEYQLAGAALEIAKAESSRAYGLLYNLRDLVDTIRDAGSDKDAIEEAISDYFKRDWESDKAATSEAVTA